MIAHNDTLISILRPAISRFARRHIVATILLSAAAPACIWAPMLWTQEPAIIARQLIPTPPPTPASRPARKIIATSDAALTIHFTGCRENDKHHVSCQFTDANGDSHWVYLAGVALAKPQ